MSTFLVTGNAGFIGSGAVDMLIAKGHDVYGIDGLYEGSCLKNINPNIKKQYKFPLHEMGWMNKVVVPDYIWHFAALSNVDTSINSPSLFNWNYLATSNVLEFAKTWKIPVIHIGSDEEYGCWDSDPDLTMKEYLNGYSEISKLRPSSPYAASKAACSLLALSYYYTWDLNVIVTRCSNNYGIRQQDKLIPTVCKKIFNGEKIPIFETPATRDWIHFSDQCSAIYNLMCKGSPGEIYNISANEEKSPLEIVNLMGFSDKIELVEDRPGYDLRYFCNSSKLRALGWRPEKKIEEELPKIRDWYLNKALPEGYFDKP